MCLLSIRFLGRKGVSKQIYDELVVAFDTVVASQESEDIRNRVASLQFLIIMCVDRVVLPPGDSYRVHSYAKNFLRALWTQASHV